MQNETSSMENFHSQNGSGSDFELRSIKIANDCRQLNTTDGNSIEDEILTSDGLKPRGESLNLSQLGGLENSGRCSVGSSSTQFDWLMEFPIVSFGIPLGISSQATLWKTMHDSFMATPSAINWVLWCFAILTLVVSFFLYCLKAIYYPNIVKAEFGHPRRVNFFIAPILAILVIMSGTPESAKLKELITVFWFICFLLQMVGIKNMLNYV